MSFFEGAYQRTPPWDIGRPQPALQAISGQLSGRVLDAGCGTGEHALMAAELGLDATGIDGVEAAVETARTKAAERGLEARFIVGDVLQLGSLGERFDTVLDCGLFHGLDDDERERYVAALGQVIPPGGRYFMLCFSDRQPGAMGPRRITREEIRAAFADGWHVDAVDPVVLETNVSDVQAWRASITRT